MTSPVSRNLNVPRVSSESAGLKAVLSAPLDFTKLVKSDSGNEAQVSQTFSGTHDSQVLSQSSDSRPSSPERPKSARKGRSRSQIGNPLHEGATIRRRGKSATRGLHNSDHIPDTIHKSDTPRGEAVWSKYTQPKDGDFAETWKIFIQVYDYYQKNQPQEEVKQSALLRRYSEFLLSFATDKERLIAEVSKRVLNKTPGSQIDLEISLNTAFDRYFALYVETGRLPPRKQHSIVNFHQQKQIIKAAEDLVKNRQVQALVKAEIESPPVILAQIDASGSTSTTSTSTIPIEIEVYTLGLPDRPLFIFKPAIGEKRHEISSNNAGSGVIRDAIAHTGPFGTLWSAVTELEIEPGKPSRLGVLIEYVDHERPLRNNDDAHLLNASKDSISLQLDIIRTLFYLDNDVNWSNCLLKRDGSVVIIDHGQACPDFMTPQAAPAWYLTEAGNQIIFPEIAAIIKALEIEKEIKRIQDLCKSAKIQMNHEAYEAIRGMGEFLKQSIEANLTLNKIYDGMVTMLMAYRKNISTVKFFDPHQKQSEHIYKTFGQLVHSRREDSKLSQEELSRRTGLSEATIKSIEKGNEMVPLDKLYLFALALSCKPADLLPKV